MRHYFIHRRFRPWLSLLLGVFLILFGTARLFAEQVAAVQPATSSVVTLGDQHVYTIRTSIGPFTAAERAAATSGKLAQLMKDRRSNPDDIHAVEHDNSTDIVSGDLILATVTDADANAVARPRDTLVDSNIHLMRSAILKVRSEYTYKSIILGAVYALLSTITLFFLLISFRRLFPLLYAKIEGWRGTFIRDIRLQSLQILSEERLAEILLSLARFLRFTITALLLYFYIPLVFSFFPWTRSYGDILLGYIATPIHSGWVAFAAYVPRLLVVFVIAFFAYLALRITRYVFREVERGTISWSGFYPEWALPTQKILQLLIIAFALVVAFPYLPGSDSPAFKGVSIFLGVLFSLGSSSAVANVIAGILLTYTRAFQVGDRVQISDTTGDIMQKGLLATQIRTIKNVLVTIPNALVLGSHIVNFSRSPQTHPLILHTTITIGYDVPWRQIHSLLLDAAAATDGLLTQPAPFVLQTSLDNSYVAYQINAYTAQPSIMANIYSDLNQSIQDKFNAAGVEIMSPEYASLRDGNTVTIPPSDRPPDYEPTAFRVSTTPSPESSGGS